MAATGWCKTLISNKVTNYATIFKVIFERVNEFHTMPQLQQVLQSPVPTIWPVLQLMKSPPLLIDQNIKLVWLPMLQTNQDGSSILMLTSSVKIVAVTVPRLVSHWPRIPFPIMLGPNFRFTNLKFFLSKCQIQLGLLLDDEKNHLVSDFVEMRDRLSDVDRQGYHYRIFKASHYASKMEILPYDQWAPMSADHHYLNGVGRQYMAENDEKEIVDVSTPPTFPTLGPMPPTLTPTQFCVWSTNHKLLWNLIIILGLVSL